jgi:hypothetical protein
MPSRRSITRGRSKGTPRGYPSSLGSLSVALAEE